MPRQKRLTQAAIDRLQPREKRYQVPDPECPGLYLRVTPAGGRTFTIVCRDPAGRQIWRQVEGAIVGDPLDDVRAKAREGVRRLRAGLEPFPPPPPKPESFGVVVANYLDLHVEGNGLERGPLRSRLEIERIIHKYILPQWRDRDFEGIQRSDVTRLLDGIVKHHGARQADYVLAIVRGIMNWQATHLDHYVSPIIRGMSRTDPDQSKRKRILSDDEIRAIWPHLSGAFGGIVKILLLTGQRCAKVREMRWADVGEVWTIPAEPREKSNAKELALPQLALAIIRAQPQTANPYVFAGRGAGPFNGLGRSKVILNRQVGIQPWVLHDLRRTARSLMSRAGVRPDIAERVLGHAIRGIEGIYDRHSYADEKRDALAALGALVQRILDPVDNVVELGGRA